MYTDEPQLRLSDDRMSRARFVTAFVDVLDRLVVGGNPSSVVALVGPWGSGKTSLVNFVIEALPESRWRVRRFNPWATGSVEALLEEFFTTIAAALPEGSRYENARRRLSDIARIATPALAAVPIAGDALKGIAEAITTRVQAGNTLASEAEKLADELGKLDVPILLVVDDVDRLQPDELLALFRALRILGRLPSVQYLIAYDEETVLDVLEQTPLALTSRSRAVAFLQKVVQIRLDLPPMQAMHAEQEYSDGLLKILAPLNVSLTGEQQGRLVWSYLYLMSTGLRSPRDINLYLAQADVCLPLVHPSEIDIPDFLVLTYIRLRYPDLYRQLPRWRSELLSGRELRIGDIPRPNRLEMQRRKESSIGRIG